MTFSADSHFLTGNAHLNQGRPCQDYSLTGNAHMGGRERCFFAIVSDGCSTGRDTDVGARIVALATKRALQCYWRGSILESRLDNINACQQALGVSSLDLLATCITAVISSEGGYIRVEGDGVVVIKHRDGSANMHKLDWGDNTPWYPVYGFDSKLFIQKHGGNPDVDRLTKEHWISNHSQMHALTRYPLSSARLGVTIPISEEQISEIECIAIFSDGICQIDDIDWRDAIRGLLSFKSTAGEFVKRRMNAFVRDCLKGGYKPQDDLSAAVIRIEHEP